MNITDTTQKPEIKKDIFKRLTHFYDSKGYFDLYGGSAAFSILFTISAFSLVSYFMLQKSFTKIRKDWPNQRCNPQVIPLAGIINKDPHKSILETTSSNFEHCVNNVLVNITGDFLQPIYYITSIIQNMIHGVSQDVQMIRTKISSIVNNVETIDSEIMTRIFNFMIPIQKMTMKIKDVLGKFNGVLTISLYSAITTYYGFKSFILLFLIVIGIVLAFCLTTAAVLYTVAGVLSAIPFVGTLLSIPFYAGAAAMTGFAAFFTYQEIQTARVLHLVKEKE